MQSINTSSKPSSLLVSAKLHSPAHTFLPSPQSRYHNSFNLPRPSLQAQARFRSKQHVQLPIFNAFCPAHLLHIIAIYISSIHGSKQINIYTGWALKLSCKIDNKNGLLPWKSVLQKYHNQKIIYKLISKY